jgi:hypothetical protein
LRLHLGVTSFAAKAAILATTDASSVRTVRMPIHAEGARQDITIAATDKIAHGHGSSAVSLFLIARAAKSLPDPTEGGEARLNMVVGTPVSRPDLLHWKDSPS